MLYQKFLDFAIQKTIKIVDLIQTSYSIGGELFAFSSSSSTVYSYLEYPFIDSYLRHTIFSFGFSFEDNPYPDYLNSQVFYPGYSGLDYSDYQAISDNIATNDSEILIPDNDIISFNVFVGTCNSLAEYFVSNLSLFYHDDLQMVQNNILAFREYLLYDYFSSGISVPIGIKLRSASRDEPIYIYTCDAFMLEFMYDLQSQNIITEYENEPTFFSNYSFLYVNVDKIYSDYDAFEDEPHKLILMPVCSSLNNYILFNAEIVTLFYDEIDIDTIKEVKKFLEENEIVYIPNERVIYKNKINKNIIKVVTDLESRANYDFLERNSDTKCYLFKIKDKNLERISCRNDRKMIEKIDKSIKDGFVKISEDYHKFKNKTGENSKIYEEFYHAAYKKIEFDKNDFYVEQVDFINLYPSFFVCSPEQQELGIKQKAEGIIRYACIKFIDNDQIYLNRSTAQQDEKLYSPSVWK